MKMKQRLLSILLSLVLMLGLMMGMSTTAYADGLVTQITLDRTSIYLAVGGDSTYLWAQVTPYDAVDSSVTWSSSNSAVAAVTDRGEVKPVAEGTATITVTANDGSGVSASCTVTVVKLFEVTFAYGDKTYKITSGKEVYISDITGALVNEYQDATAVTCSDESLFSAEKINNTNWRLNLKKPFSGSKTMTVTIGDTNYTFTVTCWEPTVPQSGENKYVRYCKGYYGFDARGKSESGDIQTTCGNQGYLTQMKVGDNEAISFNDFYYGKPYTSNDVTAVITGRVRGKSVEITYTLTNSSNEAKTVQIGSSADTQIGDSDRAPCSFTDDGIKMTSTDGKIEFKLIPVGGNFTTRWYGYYGEASSNVFVNRTDTSVYDEDSGVAWSWIVEIPANGEVKLTAALSAGEAGTTQIIYDANGGTGDMDPTVEVPDGTTKVILEKNTFTWEDHVFQGWDTDSAGKTVVYADEAELVMPDADMTLYAVWKENTEITAAAEGFEGAYDGKEHGITVTVTDPSSGATIKYGKTAGTYDLDASPTITNVVDSPLTVYFKVTADGYKDYTGSATVTVGKADAVAATVTANSRTYDGTDKPLVTVDDSTMVGGTMWYALGADATTAPEFDGTSESTDKKWSITIPAKTSAGTYYVWYKVVGDDNHSDTTPASVTVTIGSKAMTVSAADVTATVDGQPHGVTVNVTDPATGYTVKYGTEAGSYTLDASPTQTEAGTKTVYYQVTADNYTTYTGSAKVTISAKQTQTITASDVTVTYGDTDKKVTAATDGNGAISYAVKEGSGDYIEVDASTGALTIKKVPADGKAYVTVTAAGTATYEQATKDVTVTINKANAVAATVTANSRTYDGTEKPLVTVTGEPTGGEMQYALGTATEATQPYTTSIPAKTEAGTYYVWYKVKADDTHIDSNPFCVTVKISKKPAEEEEPEKPAEVKTVAMYRLYNPFNREHLYTESENEKNVLSTKYGWKYEGIAWYAPEKSNTPVYRLYNPVLRDHHYTTDKHEKDVLSTKYGWKYEGIGWYSDDNKTVPIYRVFCPFITSGSHHFTAGKNEVKHLISVGWIDEKIGWYGVKEK